MTKQKILIIDDDPSIGDLLEEALKKESYMVLRAFSGTEALLVLNNEQPDLILLDLMLPGLSGEDILDRIKHIPTIIVSAKLDLDHKVDLLLEGAADYIVKPFELKELLARVKVALRKNGILKSKLYYDELVLDPELRELVYVNKAQKLTKTENRILETLLSNSEQVITKSQLLDMIFEESPECTENSLKTHMSNLRKKIRTLTGRDYIESVWGIGFKMQNLNDLEQKS